jgi:branched-chain amino acid transport system substrate-binding protein
VAAVLGPYASGLAFVTTQEAEKYKIPHVLDVAIADQITDRGFTYTFRLAPNASMGARHTVDSLQAMVKAAGVAAKRVVLMHEDGIFGKTTADTLQKLLPPAGFEVVERIPHATNATSLTSDVLRLKSARADILLPSTYYGPHGMLLRTVAEQRVDLQAIASVYGGAGSQYRFIADVGKLSEYMMDGNHWYNPKHPRIRGVIEAFQKRFNQPFAYEWLLAYVSVHVLRDALERAGSTEREKLREALAGTNLRDEVVPYPISFDAKGQNAGARTLMMQVQKGRIAVVHPAEYTEARAIIPMPRWGERG